MTAFSEFLDVPHSTAAPGATGTAGSTPAHDCKESKAMTIISHPKGDSVHGRQMIAALTLAKMLAHELPVADWSIGFRSGRITGVIDAHHDDTEARSLLGEWSEFLGSPVREFAEQVDTFHWLRLYIDATYQNVPVRIATLGTPTENPAAA